MEKTRLKEAKENKAAMEKVGALFKRTPVGNCPGGLQRKR